MHSQKSPLCVYVCVRVCGSTDLCGVVWRGVCVRVCLCTRALVFKKVLIAVYAHNSVKLESLKDFASNILLRSICELAR